MKAIFLLNKSANVRFLIKKLSCIAFSMLLLHGASAQKVKKIDPVITWHTPAPITYGTALSGVQLNATANVDGTFKYTPGAGALLNAGTHTLSTTINPKDRAKYNNATATVALIVNKATATLTLSNLSQSYDGSPKPVTVTTDPAGLSGVTVTYDGASTAPAAAGSYAVVASLNDQNYQASSVTGTLVISKTTSEKVGIVVLGSSTAAGTGASSYSNSWVGLLTTKLNNDYPNTVTVTNLARGGYTTYHILPTGTNKIDNRPAVDPSRNVSAALDLGPQIIIINMPSNDVASGYTDAETLNNYATVINTALTAGVRVLLTGTQPRSDISLSIRPRLQSQNQSLLSIYGNDCTNIYDELTDLAAYTIKTQYSAGDNIHLNNAGHHYIYSQLLAPVKASIEVNASAHVSQSVLTDGIIQEDLLVSAYPNPFSDNVSIRLQTRNEAKATIALYDMSGALILKVYDGNVTTNAETKLELPGRELATGIYFLRVEVGINSKHKRLVLIR